MKKKYLITLLEVIGVIILFSIIILSYNDINMNEALELRVPILTKREKVQLQNGDFFNEEDVKKIHLSNIQMKTITNKVQKNENWKKENLDERLKEVLEFNTREKIFYQIPEIENYYWIFTNRSNGVNDKHSVDALLQDGMYYAISFGILDVDNNVLYYYEYDK